MDDEPDETLEEDIADWDAVSAPCVASVPRKTALSLPQRLDARGLGMIQFTAKQMACGLFRVLAHCGRHVRLEGAVHL